ncbi:nuclear transport factor 2 family protein [Maritalea sp.]|uniref:nuclear transport factor 2 family protein n=1 Tax=Maritalea sp. TaxID=2003361 RepID=UPI003EF8AB1C
MAHNTDLVSSYLDTLNQLKTGDELAKFFHPDVQQTEYPNKITPERVDRDLSKILEGAERGAQILSAQNFTINNIIATDKNVVAELTWTGTMAIPLGSLGVGDDMVAHIACIFEFKDGLIFRQRNYDCFEAF